jgi:hypothetical protein
MLGLGGLASWLVNGFGCTDWACVLVSGDMGADIPPRSIAVQIERPARPAIWLDTSALINIAKARGGRPQNEADRQRVAEIDRVVADKVRAGRLLCIESEQKHEVRESGLNLVVDVIESLSLGARLRPQIAVQYRQFEIAMRR